jgi:hypothetical protein
MRLRVSGARVGHGSDVRVLENRSTAFPATMQGGIHHGPRQIVGRDRQVGEQDPKRGVDRAQEPAAKIRFLPRLHRIDVAGPEDEYVRKSGREQRVPGFVYVAGEGQTASFCGSAPLPPKKEKNSASGTAPV